MEETIDLNGFIQALFERSNQHVKTACDGLSDDELYYQPNANSNSIGWIAWHFNRVKDQVTATIAGEDEAWISEGWAERYGMTPRATGAGDTQEEVAAFRFSRELLFGYVDAAHRATMRRLSDITPQQLTQPVRYVLGDTRPVWQALRGMLGDTYQHTGQISYLRGMITGYGWRTT